MINLYLSLGSNLGDRKANLEEALRRLDEAFGTGYASLSDFIETESWGFEAGKFINCAVLYQLPWKRQTAEDQALDILSKVKGIERAMGREEQMEFTDDGRRVYHSRVIDIDILFFGRHKVDLPQLKIPHPLISERDFVLLPLEQIAKISLKQAFPVFFINK